MPAGHELVNGEALNALKTTLLTQTGTTEDREIQVQNWPGLGRSVDHQQVAVGEMLFLSPVARAAVMMVRGTERQPAITVLLATENETTDARLTLLAEHLAEELLLDGELGGDHLTQKECLLLRQLIGIGENNKATPPLTVLELANENVESAGKLVEKQVGPMMRKIRELWGQPFLDSVATESKKMSTPLSLR